MLDRRIRMNPDGGSAPADTRDSKALRVDAPTTRTAGVQSYFGTVLAWNNSMGVIFVKDK